MRTSETEDHDVHLAEAIFFFFFSVWFSGAATQWILLLTLSYQSKQAPPSKRPYRLCLRDRRHLPSIKAGSLMRDCSTYSNTYAQAARAVPKVMRECPSISHAPV